MGKKMMNVTVMKIDCCTCGNHFDVYEVTDHRDERARTCPFCGQTIDRQTWEQFVIPAFGMVRDANAQLWKDYHGYSNQPLFRIGFMAK